MINPIPERIKKVWDKWNIRGLILFSLSLQIILILFAPLRKRSSAKLVIFLIWSAYLFADWAANFGVGLIADNARDTPHPSENNELLAFWAPFMLVHLGGPDSITAFSLADNELWLRHLLTLMFQVVGTVYIFLLTLPGNKLSIPTILVLIAGTIKYSERIRALYLASVEKFRASTLGEGEELGGIEHYAIRTGRNWDWNFRVAYRHFEDFKALFVDLSVGALKSYYFFEPGYVGFSPEAALRIIEIELSLAYQVFYTKIPVTQSVLRIILRSICFGSVVAALLIFDFQIEKHGFNEFDVRVTYTLLLGAIALDIIAFFMLVLSDGTFVTLWNYYDESRLGKIKNCIAAILRQFVFLKSSQWETCHSHSKHKVLATNLLFRRWSGSISGFSWMRYCLEESPSREHKVKSSYLNLQIFDKLILFTAMAINCFIHTTSKLIQFLHIYKIIQILHIHQVIALLGLDDIVDGIRIKASLSHEPLTEELWEFVFEEVKRKRGKAGDLAADWRRFFQSRDTGDVIEEIFDESFADEVRPLISFIKSFPREDDRFSFVDSLVLWHLATEYFYRETPEIGSREKTRNAREVSKILSDYMMYLFVSKVIMINFSESLSKNILEDLRIDGYNLLFINTRMDLLKAAWESIHQPAAHHNYLLINARRDLLKDAWEYINNSKSTAWENIQQPETSNDRLISKSRFAHGAIELVVKLDNLKDKVNVWDLISKVWVELLSNASIHCSGTAHVQQLANGGELLTFVWLLLHYFSRVELL